MRLLSRLDLRQRILGGLLLSVLIVGVSSAIGILSLRRVRGCMAETARSVDALIRRQNEENRHLHSVPGIIAGIAGARDTADLQVPQQAIQASVSGIASDAQQQTQRDAVVTEMLATVGDFLSRKRQQLVAVEHLTALRRSAKAAVADIKAAAVEAEDAAHFETILAVESHLVTLKDGVAKNGADAATGNTLRLLNRYADLGI